MASINRTSNGALVYGSPNGNRQDWRGALDLLTGAASKAPGLVIDYKVKHPKHQVGDGAETASGTKGKTPVPTTMTQTPPPPVDLGDRYEPSRTPEKP